jgi:predicted SAM-dependent methyltransferase
VVRCLNLGCGSRYVQGWANLDFVATKDVIGHDLRKPLPFADGEFDIVYHSHVLEHFSKIDATRFLRECWRVLKPGGLCRIAVPDLEGIATFYLREVDSLRRGGGSRSSNHEWMLLELYDQVVRTQPGGAMVEFLERETLENEDFVTFRLGIEAKRIIERSRTLASASSPESSALHSGGEWRELRCWPEFRLLLCTRQSSGKRARIICACTTSSRCAISSAKQDLSTCSGRMRSRAPFPNGRRSRSIRNLMELPISRTRCLWKRGDPSELPQGENTLPEIQASDQFQSKNLHWRLVRLPSLILRPVRACLVRSEDGGLQKLEAERSLSNRILPIAARRMGSSPEGSG